MVMPSWVKPLLAVQGWQENRFASTREPVTA
jgi:hypothetical protein